MRVQTVHLRHLLHVYHPEWRFAAGLAIQGGGTDARARSAQVRTARVGAAPGARARGRNVRGRIHRRPSPDGPCRGARRLGGACLARGGRHRRRRRCRQRQRRQLPPDIARDDRGRDGGWAADGARGRRAQVGSPRTQRRPYRGRRTAADHARGRGARVGLFDGAATRGACQGARAARRLARRREAAREGRAGRGGGRRARDRRLMVEPIRPDGGRRRRRSPWAGLPHVAAHADEPLVGVGRAGDEPLDRHAPLRRVALRPPLVRHRGLRALRRAVVTLAHGRRRWRGRRRRRRRRRRRWSERGHGRRWRWRGPGAPNERATAATAAASAAVEHSLFQVGLPVRCLRRRPLLALDAQRCVRARKAQARARRLGDVGQGGHRARRATAAAECGRAAASPRAVGAARGGGPRAQGAARCRVVVVVRLQRHRQGRAGGGAVEGARDRERPARYRLRVRRDAPGHAARRGQARAPAQHQVHHRSRRDVQAPRRPPVAGGRAAGVALPTARLAVERARAEHVAPARVAAAPGRRLRGGMDRLVHDAGVRSDGQPVRRATPSRLASPSCRPPPRTRISRRASRRCPSRGGGSR